MTMMYDMFTTDNIVRHLNDHKYDFVSFAAICHYVFQSKKIEDNVDLIKYLVNYAKDLIAMNQYISRCFGWYLFDQEAERYVQQVSGMLCMLEISTKLTDLNTTLQEGEYHFEMRKN